VENTPPSKRNSEDDPDRRELLWEQREEILLHKWKNEMHSNAVQHRISGRFYKRLYVIFGLPSVLIPIIIGSLSEPLKEFSTTKSLLMILCGLLTGITTFFNLGKRYTDHGHYEHMYTELARSIESELSRPKAFRQPCDVYLEKIRLRFGNLNNQAPWFSEAREKKY
jgi:hypothetical protein